MAFSYHPVVRKKEYEKTGFKHPPLTSTFSRGNLQRRIRSTNVTLPDNFVYSPNLLTPERDQGQCGSCWAFAITTVMADIIKIKHQFDVPLSVQQLLQCLAKDEGCNGIQVSKAIEEIPSLISEERYPYVQYDGNTPPSTKCVSHAENQYYATAIPYVIDGEGQSLIDNMKAHIFHDGPIVGIMNEVYPDLSDYDGVSIYDPKPGQTSEGGHAIEILGWGKNHENVEYWICRNSWGNEWPKNHINGMGRGWFYVKMGVNASQIEEFAYALIPAPHNVAFAPNIDGDDSYSIPGKSIDPDDTKVNILPPKLRTSIIIGVVALSLLIAYQIIVKLKKK